ncbi:hypothetical protein ACVWWI_006639 [Bradyrhizobium sp. USDA 3686]|nr:hypothetical protein [Bradyrhizobium canariense]
MDESSAAGQCPRGRVGLPFPRRCQRGEARPARGKFGLLPGAGGTQRLPRAVRPELAVGAAEALKNSLIEEIVEGAAAGGEAFMRKLLAEKRPLRRLRDDDSKLRGRPTARSSPMRSPP